MNVINFLPSELKEKGFRRKNFSINFIFICIVLLNIILACHIFYGVYVLNLNSEKINSKEHRVFSKNISNSKTDAIDFFENNINGHFIFDGININGTQISIKFKIKDKDEFAKYVKDIEEIQNCNIEYLIAPYDENGTMKFEAGLEVIK